MQNPVHVHCLMWTLVHLFSHLNVKVSFQAICHLIFHFNFENLIGNAIFKQEGDAVPVVQINAINKESPC